MDYRQYFSQRAQAAQADPIDALLKIVVDRPSITSFAVGTPDTTLLPVELLAKLTRQAIKSYGRSILQYGLPKGFAPLIEAAQQFLQNRGVVADASTIHISTGASGALNNACMALLDAGDIVLVETPTYSPAVKTARAYGATIVPIACDQQGMLPEALAAQLHKQPAKFIYVMPTFQNPTGRVMPTERRKQVARLAQKHGTLIIEDDVYAELRYQGKHLPPLWTFAPQHVLYLTSVSKILAPAMRVGFAVVPEPVLAKFLLLKHSIDMTTSPLTQALSAEFLKAGNAERHLKLLQKTYGGKLKVMVAALKTHMPADFTWNEPEGGLFLWVEGPKSFDAQALLESAIDANVAFMPGSGFYVGRGEGHNTMRLSFAHPSAANIQQGITTLARLCKKAAHAS